MNGFRVRVWVAEHRFMDTVIHADTWYNAGALGEGQRPVRKAVLLGNV